METENWVNEIFNSTNGMTKVIPDDLLLSKIYNRINKEKTFSNRWVWIAAASFGLLISLNVKMVFANTSNAKIQTQTLAATMAKTNQLY